MAKGLDAGQYRDHDPKARTVPAIAARVAVLDALTRSEEAQARHGEFALLELSRAPLRDRRNGCPPLRT